MKIKTLFTLTTLTLSLGLTGCGGDEDTTKHIQGTLVAPKASAKVIAKVLQKAEGVKFKDECPNVPAGYSPLKKVTVEFLDNARVTKEKTTTDECGNFSASVPNEVTQVKAKSSGNRDLVVEVSVFQSTGASALASTIPSNADYQISSIQMTADDKVAFSVTDTVTNNAVIGIPLSAISAKINTNDVGVSKLDSAANISDPASVTLVMDASGSMTKRVYDKDNNELVDKNGYSMNRFRITHLAAHTYLDNIPKEDETAFIVFSSDVDFLNDKSFNALFPNIKDSTDNPITYKFSADGYSKDASKLRLLVDAYNPYTTLYLENGVDEPHTDSPKVKLGNSYPWGSSTALFKSAVEAVEQTSKRNNSRKIVVLMSDGINNKSPSSKDVVIDLAKQKAIPVHTIAYGGGSDETTMKSIAEQTNASFFKATGQDLVGAFRSIQTSITFQYLAGLIEKAEKGNKVTITLNYNGEEASREVIR